MLQYVYVAPVQKGSAFEQELFPPPKQELSSILIQKDAEPPLPQGPPGGYATWTKYVDPIVRPSRNNASSKGAPEVQLTSDNEPHDPE